MADLIDNWFQWVELGQKQPRSRTVLLVNANQEDALFIKSSLGEGGTAGFALEWLTSLDAALERLRIGGIDALIVELKLLYYENIDALLAMNKPLLEVATVVLAEPEEEASAIKAVQLGFNDHYIKGKMSADQLRLVVNCAIEQKEIQNELQNLCLVDEPTGLYTLRAFLVLSQHFLKLANRTNRGLVLFLVEFRNPSTDKKPGTPAPYDPAVDFANVLKSTFRRSDIISRMSGSKFAVLALESSEAGAAVINTRLHANLNQLKAKTGQPRGLHLQVGSAYYSSEAPSAISDLLTRARKSAKVYGNV